MTRSFFPEGESIDGLKDSSPPNGESTNDLKDSSPPGGESINGVRDSSPPDKESTKSEKDNSPPEGESTQQRKDTSHTGGESSPLRIDNSLPEAQETSAEAGEVIQQDKDASASAGVNKSNLSSREEVIVPDNILDERIHQVVNSIDDCSKGTYDGRTVSTLSTHTAMKKLRVQRDDGDGDKSTPITSNKKDESNKASDMTLENNSSLVGRQVTVRSGERSGGCDSKKGELCHDVTEDNPVCSTNASVVSENDNDHLN